MPAQKRSAGVRRATESTAVCTQEYVWYSVYSIVYQKRTIQYCCCRAPTNSRAKPVGGVEELAYAGYKYYKLSLKMIVT